MASKKFLHSNRPKRFRNKPRPLRRCQNLIQPRLSFTYRLIPSCDQRDAKREHPREATDPHTFGWAWMAPAGVRPGQFAARAGHGLLGRRRTRRRSLHATTQIRYRAAIAARPLRRRPEKK